MKRYLTCLLLVVVATYVLCAFYSMRFDPEVRFWKKLADIKLNYAANLSNNTSKKVVFVGGSSCTFSIRPDVLEESGIFAVNMGMHAGMGPLFNSSFGCSVLNEGDLLVVALETDTFKDPNFNQSTTLGVCTAMVLGDGNLAVGGVLFGKQLTVRQMFSAIRPGGRKVVTMLSKAFLRLPPYRYSLDEIGAGGWCYTSYDREQARPNKAASTPAPITEDGLRFIKSVKNYAMANDIDVFLVLPWQLTASECVENNRRVNRDLCTQIEAIIPVVYDGYDGCCTNVELYADTGYHLTPEGAKIRTEAFLKAFVEMRDHR
jgi:hypothetical protein